VHHDVIDVTEDPHRRPLAGDVQLTGAAAVERILSAPARPTSVSSPGRANDQDDKT
jgi:hypothetical protein